MHLVEKMAYYGETPWHGLGTKAETAMNAEEALVMGGLDFEVAKVPLFLEGGVRCNGHFAMVRTDRAIDNVLGVVQSRYTPLQNHEAFTFFDPFITRQEAMFHTVGSLKGGRKVWILAKLPGEIRLLGGQDITEQYLLISNSHDGTSGVQIRFTPIRVVCNNTLTAALSRRGAGATTYNIRHTQSVQQAVAEASKVMGISNSYFSELNEAFARFTEVQLDGTGTKEFLERCFAKEAESAEKGSTKAKNILSEINRLVEEGAGTDIPGVRGTVWGAYNAVTEYIDNGKNYRNPDTRLDNAWFNGVGQSVKQRAFDLAVELVR